MKLLIIVFPSICRYNHFFSSNIPLSTLLSYILLVLWYWR